MVITALSCGVRSLISGLHGCLPADSNLICVQSLGQSSSTFSGHRNISESLSSLLTMQLRHLNLMQDAAFTLGSLYVTICLVLCGFYIRISDIRLSVLKGLSWACFSKYTFQGLAVNELKDRPYDIANCKSTTPCESVAILRWLSFLHSQQLLLV